MPKRFCDTDIWKNQRWFRKLSPAYKLAFLYIKDECNHAGIWKIDCADLIEDIGLTEFSLTKFVEAVNVEYDKVNGKKIQKERLRIVNKSNLWVTGFIQFQYEGKDGKVSASTPAVRTALIGLDGFNMLKEAFDNSFITLTEPLREGWRTPKDKDKDKDIKKGGLGGNGKNGVYGDTFSHDGCLVYFSDGSSQKLGASQLLRFKNQDIKPQEIKKGTVI